MRLPTESWPEFINRLGDDWKLLANYLGIPKADQDAFHAEDPGREGRGILHYLQNHKELDRLPKALVAVGRGGKEGDPDHKDLLSLWVKDHPAAEPSWTGSPYPGLAWFRPDESAIFFGRDAEVEELLRRVRDGARFLAVIGDSGSGKSSLVAAGLIPRMEQTYGREGFGWFRFTPGGLGGGTKEPEADPFEVFATGFCNRFAEVAPEPSKVHAALKRDAIPAALLELLFPRRPRARLLVFIDQFEELFTRVSPTHRENFCYLLRRMANTDRLVTAITMRADFYRHCLPFEPLVQLLREHAFPLGPPGPLALIEMIRRPAALAGLEFKPASLPGRILTDTGNEPGALALMAFALQVLYDGCAAAGCLSGDVYDRFGGVRGAIARKADEAYAALGPEARAAMEEVFKELVDVDPVRRIPTRKRAPRSRFKNSPAALALIATFEKHRLLVAGDDASHEPTIDVAHEALLLHWPTLGDWIEKRFDDFSQLRQLRLEVAEWVRREKPSEHRWAHERLAPIQLVLERLNPELSEEERDFLKPEADRLLEEISRPGTPHPRRAWIGERLAQIGDPREGIGLDEAGLPKFMWLPVPAGKITLEEGGAKKARQFEVAPFEVSQYPVTWLQYDAFVKASDGFPDPEWWEDLAERQRSRGERRWDHANHPVIHVSWFDAVAFCRWLSRRTGREIRLPTEWEWQQAATGGKAGYEYPWGKEWDDAKANAYESGINRTTAVGLYPAGASPVGAFPVGALDMSGNVWEWCLNEHENPGRIELGGDANRVAHGGAWSRYHQYARAAVRYLYHPGSRNHDLGFRVVRMPPHLRVRF